jgi:hypothetical protein
MGTSTLNIRRATPEDAEALVRIHGDMGAYYAQLAPELFHDPDLTDYAPVKRRGNGRVVTF